MHLFGKGGKADQDRKEQEKIGQSDFRDDIVSNPLRQHIELITWTKHMLFWMQRLCFIIIFMHVGVLIFDKREERGVAFIDRVATARILSHSIVLSNEHEEGKNEVEGDKKDGRGPVHKQRELGASIEEQSQ